ncbi:nuclear factor NF-kappa-B p110 subunit isoform 1 [Bombyx mori]|uniref:BmRelish1 n=1 Tax=Bombyx mori TaxID=7091 RepID=A7BJ65_BOMMO|nr:nuclear factor NF-kappa-B p110 subunit isoform 1 [Bombyx mori]BAF74125.1 BmRelish1 [Bombyx mori]
MSTTASDQDSDSSSRSPQSYYSYCSPSQQVPQLTPDLNNLIYLDNGSKRNRPFLRIIEQPQDYFRFRYASEMAGTHGCLLGKSSSTNKNKVHPTVELVNYTGQAVIKCQLAQHKTPEEHPHKLFEEEQDNDDREVSCIVPKQGIYKVGFGGMGIIHTAKKNVPGLLFQKYAEKCKNISNKELKIQCENMAKSIDLNIVRLKFSAHDISTDREICKPVFSEPIHSLKSAASNDLKICRISRCSGRPVGGEDVYIFVEKVNKKNIQIRFFELDENGHRVWTANGSFMPGDVHHQYAIIFRTPAYKDTKISKNVNVYIELARPSDGRTSEPKEFKYIAEPIYSNSKKRRMNASCSTSPASSGSLKSISDLPALVTLNNNFNDENNIEMPKTELPAAAAAAPSLGLCDLADALMGSESAVDLHSVAGNAMWSPSAPVETMSVEQFPNLQLNSTEFEKIITNALPPEERNDFTEYALSSYESFDDIDDDPNGWKFIRTLQMMQTDSARSRQQTPQTSKPALKTVEPQESSDRTELNVPSDAKDANEYSAYYNAQDGLEVKQLLRELTQIIRNKKVHKKQELKDKLKRLFDIRLSNGDTYLHMILCSNQSSIANMVTIIDSVKMTHLLDYRNLKLQTLLHTAIANDLSHYVTLLVSKGSSVSLQDVAGDTAFHYAAKSHKCLEPLLAAVKKHNIPFDLNTYNYEKQAPLHLARTGQNARHLLESGADHRVRDMHGRTPLHLAAYDSRLALVAALLDYIPSKEIDATDESGNTALQIVCGGPLRQNSVEIVKLLLAKKADPNFHGAQKESAWKMSADKPELRALLLEAIAFEDGFENNSVKSELDDEIKSEPDDEIKSEPEDDYDSADEGEETSGSTALDGMGQYLGEVSSLLDRSGSWQELAGRLRLDSLLSLYCAQPSPTHTLLLHLKVYLVYCMALQQPSL